jgi:hypothetical protein
VLFRVMSFRTKVSRARRLLRHRRECLEFLDSPRQSAALKVIRGEGTIDVRVSEGSISEEERSFLGQLVCETNKEGGPIVEIGTLFGFTTNFLALVKPRERQLITVDSFTWNPWGLCPSEHRRLTEKVLEISTALLNVKIMACDKEIFYQTYSGVAPSLVFLDAVHLYEETKKDILWARDVGCRMITGHDFSVDFPGVVEAVSESGIPEIRGSVWALRV